MKNTMIIKRIGLLLFIIIMPVYLSAQSIVVKGIVQDITGEPLMGVNVVESGTTNGVITDIEGNYSLFVPSDAKLIFSFIGCIPQTVSVNKKTTINIRMKEDTKALEEVVVVGYGSIRKSDVSGSVASVDKDMMMKKVPGNLAEGLKGSAPGVMVTAQDGAPDANAAIRIRGVATINGSAEPLYVVDGVQVGTNANFLNPSDIESIEILKDASATAIYETQGVNGVIMITTKNGTKGALQLDFSVDFSVQTLAGKLDVCNVDQYAQNIRTSRINDGANLYNQIWSAAYDGKRTAIDWQDQMTQSSIKQQYNLSASGGTDKLQGSFSLSYLDNEGIVVNTNYQRLTARANIKANVNKFIEFGGSLNFVHSESTGSNNSFNNSGNLSSLRDMAFMCPSMDYVDTNGNHVRPNVVNPDGTYGTVMQGTNVNDGTHTDNIYANQIGRAHV